MARLRKGTHDLILREITGKVGSFVIRHINGRTIICSAPKKYPEVRTPGVQRSNNKFRGASKFASCILRIDRVKEVWDQAKVDAPSAQMRIIKCNIQHAEPERPGINNTITPPHFQLRIKDVIMLEDNFMILMEDWFEPREDDKIVMVVMLYDPLEPCAGSYELVELRAENTSSGLVINMDAEKLSKLQKYKSFILYTAVIRKSGKSLEWSNTFAMAGATESPIEHGLDGWGGLARIRTKSIINRKL